ncbi:peptidase inhibitor family I36 protein [Actinomyces vulturis]|uniref:peptidase inhibitor family I36 protein n=1 Tax=Actinomyces vulturis TaxID=1857645 RepID=UPI003CCB7B93
MPAATAAPNHCDSGAACVRKESNFQTNGSTYANVQFEYYIQDFSHWNYRSTGINANDSISSVANNGTQCIATFFQHSNYQGWSFVVSLGNSRSSLAWKYNDEVSSAKFR